MALRAPVGPSPIEGIRFAGRIEIAGRDRVLQGSSPPGHLIHFHVSGKAHRECNGRHYIMHPGSAIWYYDDETLRLGILKPPVVFYSIHFLAPSFPPPDFESRFFSGLGTDLKREFQALVRAWERDVIDPARDMIVHACALRIVALLRPVRGTSHVEPQVQLWWRIENEIRKNLAARLNLRVLRKLGGRNTAAIASSCKTAVGLPPMKRVKQVRMSYARGLMQFSDKPLKAIAAAVGYPRIHEFSRDYRKQFGRAPSIDRRLLIAK
jgi:AraC-like DNA-binding protein